TFPTWSCDGSELAYISNMGQTANRIDIYIADSEGTHREPLGLTNVANDKISWSPQGDEIVYVGTLPNEHDTEIFVVEVETGSSRRITNNAWDDNAPDWSCTNGQLVFESGTGDQEGDSNLYINNLDGGYTNGTGENVTAMFEERAYSPTWYCDGR